MANDLIGWKTDAWKDPAMVAWYHQRIRLANWLERACLALQEKGTA